MDLVKKAVIPAAGHGTRFLPVTKAMPKEMLAVIDAPAIQYVVSEAAESGVEEAIIVINRSKEVIRRYFEPDGASCPAERELAELISRVKFRFVYQDEATGTANAVMLAREFTGDEPFAVMYGDDVIVNEGGKPCLAQLMDAYALTGRSVIGVQERPREEAAKYAVVKKGRAEGRLTEVLDLIEKPSPDKMPSTLSSLGRYVLTPAIYDAIERAPEFRGEKYLTHAVALLAGEEGVYAYEFEGKRYDLGDKFGFLQANIEEGRRRFGTKLDTYLKELLKDRDRKTQR